MNANNSQKGDIPSELLFGNNQHNSHLDQLLSVKIETKSQPIIPFNPTNTIPSQILSVPHHSQQQNLTTRQIGQRRRRQRRRQRRREEREAREAEATLPTNFQIPQQRRATYIPDQTWAEMECEDTYWMSVGYQEYLEEQLTPVLESYDWEKLDPKARWEQEEINELEGFVVLEQISLIQDQIEQSQQLRLLEYFEDEEQQQSNYNELIQVQQWEAIAFLLQQSNQS
jgi:hypothetical protein